jgi:hypothetical protein
MNVRKVLSVMSLLAVSLITSVAAGSDKPPANAKLLSEMARTVEQRTDFQVFESLEFDDGVYKAEYYTKDGTKKAIRLDPISGAEK